MSSVSDNSSRLNGRSCLVTGATGFLGQRLVPRLLEAGVRVTALVRGADRVVSGSRAADSRVTGDVETLSGDMAEPGWAEATRHEWRWDDVVHLAGTVSGRARSFAEEAQAARAHVQIALALSRAVPAGWSGRLIHSSSMTVYGAAPRLPVKESQALAPSFLYAFGKQLAEDVWRSAALPDYWLLRLPGLFSASRKSGALYHFVRAALLGQPIELTAAEPTLWDILHVDDAAAAIVLALASPAPFQGAMNVSYGEVVELEQIARRVAALTTRVEVINATRVVHPPFQLDISLAKARLGWPPCSIDQRLSELVFEQGAACG